MTTPLFDQALAALPRQRTQLLPALLLAQDMLGWIPDAAVERIAAHLRLTVNEAEGVAGSFPELHRQRRGGQIVRVCAGLSCWAAGGERVREALAQALHIAAGETTADGRVTLEETACAFVCAAAPAVEVDGAAAGRMDAAAAAALAARLTAAAP